MVNACDLRMHKLQLMYESQHKIVVITSHFSFNLIISSNYCTDALCKEWKDFAQYSSPYLSWLNSISTYFPHFLSQSVFMMNS